MIKKIKASRSEKIIFFFLISLAIFSLSSFFLIKNKCLFVKNYNPEKLSFDKKVQISEKTFDEYIGNNYAKGEYLNMEMTNIPTSFVNKLSSSLNFQVINLVVIILMVNVIIIFFILRYFKNNSKKNANH